MEPMPKLDRDAFVTAMRQKMEAMLGQVADAINHAPDGHIISGSEERCATSSLSFASKPLK